MNFYNSLPKVEFFSLMPDVTRIAPIVPATQFRPTLMTNASKELSQLKKEPNFGSYKMIATAKCPGIYNLARYGWVMTTWQDIVIETNGDGVNFASESATDQTKLDGGFTVGPTVGFHGPQQYANYIGGKIPEAISNVVKINTPWRCVVPKGYYLQEGPLPYTDEQRFTTVRGFFSQEFGVAQMNVQLIWHVLNGRTVIKAGTPIAHYMLLPKKQPTLVVRDATAKDIALDKATRVEIDRVLVSNRTEQKCVYAKLFKGW